MALPGIAGLGGFFAGGLQLVNARTSKVNLQDYITALLPSGVASGDFMIAIMNVTDDPSAARTWTGDTGWTELIDQNARPNLRIATKTAGSSESNPTFTTNATGTFIDLSCAIIVFRRAQYDTIGTIATSSTNGTLTYNDITSARGIVLAAFCSENGDGNDDPTVGVPSGFSLVVSSGDGKASIRVYSKTMDAGATSGLSSTISGQTATGYNGGILIGVKEA
jgi:hypothetical protein